MGSSKFIGVSISRNRSKWIAKRWSKNENKAVCNGYCYDNEETAAHASDTLARKLMKNGEHGHKLNFPDDFTEYNAERKDYSRYLGVSYDKRIERWVVMRWSKSKNKC